MLCICNQIWKHIKYVDLLHLLSSRLKKYNEALGLENENK